MTSAGAPAAVLVSVGNELLSGETVDTNAAWLGRELGALGIPVSRRTTVGDDDAAIREAVGEAVPAADLVVVTGGLGPTEDDRTRQAVAGLFGRPLVLDPARLQRLAERFRARGYGELPPSNRGQAEIPDGALALENPLGTAPGILFEEEDGVVVLLPGVPREMKAIFDSGLRPYLADRFGRRLRPLAHRTIHTTGIPESALVEHVDAALAEAGPEVMEGISLAYLPDLRGVDLRLTVSAADPEEAVARLTRAEQVLDGALRQWRFHAVSGDVAEAVLAALRQRGWTVSVAESCTAGMVAARLTEHGGSSDVVLGGVVAYANSVKEGLVDVDPATLERHGAVSGPVAEEMARGVCRAVGADVGIAVTGIAGPGGGTAEKPVGTVWIAVATPAGTVSERQQFVGDRHAVRERSAQAALALALGELRTGSPGAAGEGGGP